MKVTINDVKNVIEEADTMVEVEDLNTHESLVGQGIDSLDMANLYLLLEEKFEVSIPDEDLEQLQTIDQIITYLEDK